MPERKKGPNPYVGPNPFKKGDKFYGRDYEIRELLNLLIAQRVILLNSPSGAGKTSLIQAGLVPALEKEDFHVFPVARVYLEPPRGENGSQEPCNRYVFSALASLEANLPEDQKTPLDRLMEMSLAEYLDQEPKDPKTPDTQVLIFDQFEEILTVQPFDREGKLVFFTQLGSALRDRRRWALFAMREDFIAALDPYARSIPTHLSNIFRLDLLGVDAARQAIQKPAQDAGIDFTDEAAQKLVDDLRLVRVQSLDISVEGQKEFEDVKGPYIEPVQLQVVCSRLWDQLPDNAQSITEKEIETVGDVDSALSHYYADRIKAISEENQAKERVLRDWIDHRLITDRGLRNQVLLDPDSIGLDLESVRSLVDAHLVRQERRGTRVYLELAHDRLVRPVRDNNTSWNETHLSVLQRQANRWKREGQKPYLLLHGAALEEAEAWASANPEELAEEDRLFLEASLQERVKADQERLMAEQAIRLESAEKLAEAEKTRAEEQAAAATRLRRQALNLKIALSAALLMLIFAAGSAWYAQAQRRVAESERSAAQDARATAVAAADRETVARLEEQRQRQLAEQQRARAEENAEEAERQTLIAEQEHKKATTRQYAAQAINLKSDQPDLALLLSMEGDNLAGQIAADTGEHIFDPKSSLLDVLTGSQFVGTFQAGQDAPAGLAFSQDGSLMVSGDYSGNVILWDISTGLPVGRTSVPTSVFSLSASPDGSFVAIGDYNGGVYLWDGQSDEPELVLVQTDEDETGETGEPKPVFGQTGEPEPVLEQTFALPMSVAISPDGQSFAAAANGLYLWDTGSQTLTSLVDADYQGPLAFSQDGEMFAAVDQDGFVEVWDARNQDLVAELSRPDLLIPVLSLSFSPQGENGQQPMLVAVQDGGEIITWDLTTFQERQIPYEASGFLFAYNPARSILANDLPDGAVQICRLEVRIGLGCTALRVYAGPPGYTSLLAISPDGDLLAAAKEDGSIVIWQVAGNTLTGPPLQAHSGPVAGLAFHENEGSLKVVTGAIAEDNSLILWDVPSRRMDMPLDAVTRKQIDFISASLAYSPDGNILASGDQDGDIRLWDTGTFTLQKELSTHLLPIQSLAFNPSGKLLAAGSQDYTISIWDPASGRLVHLLEGHFASISSLAFSPDGKVLASGGMDGQVILWDVTSGQAVNKVQGINGAVLSLAFHPDGRRLAFGGESVQTRQTIGGASLFILDLRDPSSLPKDLQNPVSFVSHVAFSPDGGILASANPNGEILLWDAAGNFQRSSPLVAGEIGFITGIEFSLDGRFLIVASDRGLTLWDVFTRELYGEFPGAGSLTTGPAIEPENGRNIAVGNAQGEILFWDIATGELLEDKITGGFQIDTVQEVSALAISPDGEILASGGVEGSILFWDLASQQISGPPVLAHGRKVTGLAFSPEGDLFASGGLDGTVKIWNPGGQEVNQFTIPDNSVTAIAFRPQDHLLAIVLTDSFDISSLYLWDLSEPDSEPYWAGEPDTEDWYWAIRSLAFDEEGDRLFIGRSNGMISLLDVRELHWSAPLSAGAREGQETAVTSLALSGDGTWLASGLADGSLILWDAKNLLEVGRLTGHTASVDVLAFSPDGNILASGGADKTVYLWEVDPARWISLACRAVNRNLSLAEWVKYANPSEDEHYRETCPGARVPDDVAAYFLEQVRADQTDPAEVESKLEDIVGWSLGSQDPFLLENICTFGIERGYKEIVRPTCNRTAELWEDPWDRARFYMVIGETDLVEQAFTEITEDALFWEDEYYLNQVCWEGSLQKFPNAVMPACDFGVEIASPEVLPLVRDSRGLARALTGDYEGAIEDFQFFIDWLSGEGSESTSEEAREDILARRRRFIEALENGQNPIDDEALLELANEIY